MPKVAIVTKTAMRIPPLPRALKLLSKLDDAQFGLIRDEVSGPNGFSVTKTRSESLARQLNAASGSEIDDILASLEFLYERSRDWGDDSDPIDVARTFLKTTNLWSDLGEHADTVFARLSELIKENPVVEKARKHSWLQTGILDNATSFASFIDLRPNYAPDRSKIEDLVPTVIFGIEVETSTGDDRSCTFQMSEAGFAQLKKTVDDIERKLAVMRTDSRLAPLVAAETAKGSSR